jgi:hypothetical protein
MSSKPKASEYKASEAEKTQASVAQAEKNYFNENYAPLLREMRDQSMQEDLGGVARGVAGADTMQSLTGKPTLSGARSVDESADLASAAVGQMAAASAQGLAASRKQQTGVLGTARGQAGEAMSGLAQASRIQNTKDLQAAKAKQMVRQAKFNAAEQIGSALIAQGQDNLSSYSGASDLNKPGFFSRLFKPNDGSIDTTGNVPKVSSGGRSG